MRDDLRIGNIAALMHNYMRTKKSQPTRQAHDYLLFSDVPSQMEERRKRSKANFLKAVAKAEKNWKDRNGS